MNKDVKMQLSWADLALRRARRAAKEGRGKKLSDALYSAGVRLIGCSRRIRMEEAK